MPPGCSIESANAVGVKKCLRLVVGDGEQGVTRPASDIINDPAGHSSVCLIVNHPVRSVETHQPGGSSNPDSTARVRFDIKNVGARQRRVAPIVQRESAVVTGGEFPQPVFRADQKVVLRVHAHGINIVKDIIVTGGAKRHVNPVIAVQPKYTRTGAASLHRPLPLDDCFNSTGRKI